MAMSVFGNLTTALGKYPYKEILDKIYDTYGHNDFRYADIRDYCNRSHYMKLMKCDVIVKTGKRKYPGNTHFVKLHPVYRSKRK